MRITLDHPEVIKWTKGDRVIDSFNNSYGELFILTQRNDLFGMLRCFVIGDEVAVSVDFSHKTPVRILTEIFRKYYETF